MEESEYYKHKLSREQHYLDFQQEAIMGRLIESQEMNLFVLLKPTVFIDGDQYCVLYGEDIQKGIVGFGSTIIEAIRNFNLEFYKPISKK